MATPAAEAGAEYQGWCSRRADSDGIATKDRAAYIGRCIDDLVSADSNPDQPRSENRTRGDAG
jgi:hypothetical protein